MTTLEATVEIIKASLQESKNGLETPTNPEERAKLLAAITELHEKLVQLESAGVHYRD